MFLTKSCARSHKPMTRNNKFTLSVMENDMTRFAKWLQQARKSRGFTQDALAERADVDQGLISKYERAILPCPKLTVYALAEALSLETAEDRTKRAIINTALRSAGFAPEEEPGVSIATPMSDLVRQVMQNQVRNSPDIDLTPEQADKLISEIEQYAQFQFSRILREIDSKKN